MPVTEEFVDADGSGGGLGRRTSFSNLNGPLAFFFPNDS